jgi:hypothetical protein
MHIEFIYENIVDNIVDYANHANGLCVLKNIISKVRNE